MSETRKPNDLFDTPNMIQLCATSSDQPHEPVNQTIKEHACARVVVESVVGGIKLYPFFDAAAGAALHGLTLLMGKN
jgi:hypothetical protein